MCILYPLGIPLLFAALMRHERRTKNLKVRFLHSLCATASAMNTQRLFLLQGEQFLDSYIGFVSAGYSVKVGSVILLSCAAAHWPPSSSTLTAALLTTPCARFPCAGVTGYLLGAPGNVPQAGDGGHRCAVALAQVLALMVVAKADAAASAAACARKACSPWMVRSTRRRRRTCRARCRPSCSPSWASL